MTSTAPGPLKPRLLALVAAGLAQQQAFIAGLSAGDRAAVGAPDAWAAKDHLAHLAASKADAAIMIAAGAHGETPTARRDDPEFNARVFAAEQHRAWDAVLADLAAADAALPAALEACSEADLTDPARFPWHEGSPLWYEAFVCGYDHPSEHYEQVYLEAGDVARATAVREEAVATARRLIAETDPFGWMIYKLGCFYARIGQPDRALPALREGLAREPRLRLWMAEDAEFAALHADPAFQALLAAAAGDAAPA